MSSLDKINPTYKEIVQDVTDDAIYYINSNSTLYNMATEIVGANRKTHTEKMLYNICVDWAVKNNNEFGKLFQTELDMVNWGEVRRRI